MVQRQLDRWFVGSREDLSLETAKLAFVEGRRTWSGGGGGGGGEDGSHSENVKRFAWPNREQREVLLRHMNSAQRRNRGTKAVWVTLASKEEEKEKKKKGTSEAFLSQWRRGEEKAENEKV